MATEYKSKPRSNGIANDIVTTVTDGELRAWYTDGQHKIQLIKCCREFTGLGLKEAKDAIENCYSLDQATGKKSVPTMRGEQDLIRMFAKHSTNQPPPKLSIEEILDIFKVALINGEKLHFTDELDIIETTCKNIRKNGGLEAISRKMEEFIDKI